MRRHGSAGAAALVLAGARGHPAPCGRGSETAGGGSARVAADQVQGFFAGADGAFQLGVLHQVEER